MPVAADEMKAPRKVGSVICEQVEFRNSLRFKISERCCHKGSGDSLPPYAFINSQRTEKTAIFIPLPAKATY